MRIIRSTEEEKVSCVKNAVKKLPMPIVIDVKFAKVQWQRIVFHWTVAGKIPAPLSHISPIVKSCEKKCAINNRRWAILGFRLKPKPTFRNSTHSPRSPIAFSHQFSATLRSINIKSRKLFSFSAAHSISKAVQRGSKLSFTPEKNIKIF